MHEEGFRFLTSRDDKASRPVGKVDMRVGKSEQSWRAVEDVSNSFTRVVNNRAGPQAKGPGNSCGAFPCLTGSFRLTAELRVERVSWTRLLM